MRMASTGRISAPVNSLTKIIICAIAVLKESDSRSSETFLIVEVHNLLLFRAEIDTSQGRG